MANKVKKSDESIIIKGDLGSPTMFERQAFIKLLTKIAKRLSREQKEDVAKSA